MTDTQILIVEDETAIQILLQFQLQQAGFIVKTANNLAQACRDVDEKLPDLLLLDWMLPDGNGTDWVMQLRTHSRTRELPIILLTSRSEENDKEHGLNQGADDYITKPFSSRELIARINALLRRRAPQKTSEIIQIGTLSLLPESRQLRSGSLIVECGNSEFKLLHFLATHPSRTYTRRELLDYVWGDHVFVEERTVDVQIGRLRRLLQQLNAEHHLQTVRGSGYRFCLD
ncbi:MAG: response regulator [Alysiella sp.]|uniref:response regulator n=1 Tax=Alysiella sp. TaxID=1872483 RepID=UPI0026DCA8E6|nr:response regulator [Alysiella sp.]MDO4433304.1 response regulator [Alysiella sp.]